MAKIDETEVQELIEAAKAPVHITPEHGAWMKAEIQQPLDQDKAGELAQIPFEDVVAEFRLDAD